MGFDQEMTFVFPFILGGLVLIGVPVLIHLIMRQKPKTLRFPAFRFLIKRHKKNQRKIRLRHLLLLALRVLLIVAICLAVARPKIFNEALKIGDDRPVAAIFLFDTSYSMEYKVGQETRLEEAKKRGRELLNELPEGSRVAILDTADVVQSGKGEWLTSKSQARQRIDRLKLHHANAPVTSRLENAYRLFAELSRSKEEDTGRELTRLLCVFSDRTRGGWDRSRIARLHDLRDQVPPPYERLPFVRDTIAGLIDLLKELRTRLPPAAGVDYPEQSLIDLLGQLRERIPDQRQDDYPESEFGSLVGRVCARSRDLLAKVQPRGNVPDDQTEYRDKVVNGLQTLLRNLRGVHEIFIDVGVDNPVDLAITDLELPLEPRNNQPRQVFAPDEKIVLRAVLETVGADVDTHLHWRIGKKNEQRVAPVKAGVRAKFDFALDAQELGPGTHQVRVELGTADALAFNNSRFVTFTIRAKRNVLVIADDPAKAADWQAALKAVGEFNAVVQTPQQALEKNLILKDDYHAVCLFSVARPDRDLWNLLKDYVHKGGGLAVIPPGDELTKEENLQAYDTEAAQQLLPGKILHDVNVKDDDKKGQWNWDKMEFQHPLLMPFRAWRGDANVDLYKVPRTAKRYWLVEPHKGDALVLVTYADTGDPPALLERAVNSQGGRRGRVLLFTTPFDQKDQKWNDYLARIEPTFYVVIAHMTTSYLAGDAETVKLNFISGQDVPVASLPPAARSPTYELMRESTRIATVTVDPSASEARLPQAEEPGNYILMGDSDQRLAAFSVNMPAEECTLERVSVADVEALFGPKAVVPVDFQTDLRDALQGQWNQPLELLPFLLLLLMLVLAVENLLANKFYRREPEAQP